MAGVTVEICALGHPSFQCAPRSLVPDPGFHHFHAASLYVGTGLEKSCVYKDVWFQAGAFAALNALLDIMLVAMPAVMVWRSQMNKTRKISAIAVFATGTV